MIAIIGAGGHSRSLIPILLENNIEIEGVFDSGFSTKEEIYPNVFLNGTLDNISAEKIAISIGDNQKRKEVYLSHSAIKPQIISKKSSIDGSATLGEGNQVLAGCFINSCAQIGENNIINTNVLIEHEVSIGSHNHIAVGAIICGRVKIGNMCFIGAGAKIIDKVNICDDVIVGAGAVVVNDITEPGTYVGVPARKVK